MNVTKIRIPSSGLIVSIVAIVILAAPPSPPKAQDIRVAIVSILANEKCSTIDPKLKALANEVKKRDAGLTGYRIDRTTSKALAPGQKDSFQLIGDLTADVTVHEREKKCDK